MVTLLASIALTVVPLSAPALAEPPAPPAARDNDPRQREIERQRTLAAEQTRQAELQRNVRATQASALHRELERQKERVRRESLAAEERARGRVPRDDKTSLPLTATSGAPISLQACNDSASQQVIAPSASVVLIGKSWITKNRGLGEAFLRGVRVELSVGGVIIQDAERFFTGPAPLDDPILGRVWITRWEYPLTISAQTPIAVHVRWTIDHQLVDLVVLDADGKAVHYPAGFSAALSCTLVPAGLVTGRITGAGVGLSDGRVNVSDASTGAPRATADTNETGEFTVMLPPGSYRFFFSSANGPWVPEWWNDAKQSLQATIVTITLGAAAPRLVADLERGVFVSGRVTDSSTGLAVAGVSISATEVFCCGFFTRSGADGRYRMVVRANSAVRVGFFPQQGSVAYIGEWWNDRRSFNEADVINVTTADVPGIDAALERGVFVRGRVTDAETGLPLANAAISASVASGICCENFFASTDALGEYAMAVRTNVTLVVGFFPPSSGIPYLPSYWDGRRSFAEADQLAVATSEISGIDAALERGVFLSGRVSDAASGQGVERTTVVASVGQCCGETFFAFTAADGSYRTAVRKNVTLQVMFNPPFGSGYLREWFNDRATAAEADPVLVLVADVAGINAALDRGVFIRGRVTDAVTGAAIAGTNITAMRADIPCCDSSFASTDVSGDYAVVVRRNTQVTVSFDPPFGSTVAYVRQWYNGKPSFETADVIAVGVTDVLGINAALERGVFLSGVVTDAEADDAIGGAGVNAFVGSSCCLFASTDSQGRYRLTAPRNVSVKISFSAPFGGEIPYIGQWYRGKATFDAADIVVVGTDDVSGLDAALERGVFVRGRVTDAQSGAGLANAGVNAQRVDAPCCEVFFMSADSEGNYVLTVKRDIKVKVGFFPPFDDPIPHLSEWWNDKRSFSEADELVIAGSDVGEINGALDRGVFVRGHVTVAETGDDLAQVSVNAFNVEGACCENFFGFTNAAGAYAMAVRQNVRLKVSFFPPFGSDLLQEYYNDKADFGSADVLAVGVAEVSGIDAALERGIRLSGRVSDTSGGGIPDVRVNVQTEACCAFVVGTGTTFDGTYSLAVRPGRYKVGFFPQSSSGFLSEYYNNKPHSGVADVVVVGALPLTGIDATLERGLTITGQVTDSTTGSGVQGIFVSATPAVCCGGGAGTTTAADGTYSFAVPPGSYKVGFFPPNTSDLVPEYYNDASDFFSATVLVLDTAPISGIDASLDRGARVNGLVRNPEGAGVLNAVVSFSDPTDGRWLAGTGTNDDGTFTIVVRPRSYKVVFQPPAGSDLVFEHYNDKLTFDTADVVTATIGTPLNLVATLDRGVRLSGRVRDAGGAGIPGVNVNVLRADVGSFAGFASTASDGSYSVPLRAGSYRIGFFPSEASGLAFEFYDNKLTFGEANIVEVGASPVTGVDAVLEPPQVLIVDARMAQNVGTSDFIERDDVFQFQFNRTMNADTTGDTLRIQDQDGTLLTLRCGAAPNNVSCEWGAGALGLTIRVAAGLVLPAVDSGDSGSLPGVQIPFNIVGLTGFTDVNGILPNLLGSPDRLVDFE